MASLNARSLLADVAPNADRNGWATAVVTTFVIDDKFLSSGARVPQRGCTCDLAPYGVVGSGLNVSL